MLLFFESEELRTLCEDLRVAEARFGAYTAKQMVARLADIRATPRLIDLPYQFQIEMTADGFTVTNRIDGITIIAVPGHGKSPLTENGDLDLAQVVRLRIIYVEAQQ